MSQTKAQLISDLVQALNFTGTASAPANGLFLSATNTLQLSTANTPRLTINSDGHVDVVGNLDVGAGIDVTGAITSTGNITITNDQPRITFADSNNNPDYLIDDDGGNLRFFDSTNSATRLLINSDGHVDVTGNLDVGAGIDVTGALNVTNSGSSTSIRIENGNADFLLQAGDTGSDGLHFYDMDNTAYRMTIANDGNVGIGTTSPAEKLDINGNIKLPDDGTVHFGVSDTAFVRGKDSTDGYVKIGTNGVEAARFDAAKTLRMNECPSLDATAGSINITGGGSGGRIVIQGTSTSAGAGLAEIFAFWGTNKVAGMIALSGADTTNKDDGHLTFMTSSAGPVVTERMRIDSSGNVGIGTTSPGDNLDIASGVPTLRLTDTDGGPSYHQIKGPGNGDLRISCDVGNTSSSASEIQFDIHDSNKMVIQSTGNVGIGTTSPGQKLGVSGNIRFEAADPTLEFNNGGAMIYARAANTLQFASGGGPSSPQEKLRIDSSGNVGIGNSDPKAQLHVNSDKNAGTDKHDASNYHLVLRNPQDDSGEECGIGFSVTSNATKIGAAIMHERDSGGSEGSLQFYTNGDGNSVTERMRITAGGDIDIAEAIGQSISSKVAIQHSGTNPRGLFVLSGSTVYQSITLQSACSRNTTNGSYRHFQCSINGVADKMRVYDNGNIENTNNSYGSLSDETLKENIVDAGSQWNDIKNIRVRKFNFKSLTDPDQKTMLGVVAQEAELVCPNLVTTKVSLQEGVEKEYKSFKYSVLYMKAIKALQEAITKIETLETKVAALEAA